MYACLSLGGSRSSQRAAITATVREVADLLGNTPAVCRSSYIDPRVFDRFREGITIRLTLADAAHRSDRDSVIRDRIERAVLDLLDDGGIAIAA